MFKKSQDNPFNFKNFGEALEEAKITFKERPNSDSDLYTKFYNRTRGKGFTVKDVFNKLFGEKIISFEFSSLEEAIEEAKQKFDKRPKYRENGYSSFVSRAKKVNLNHKEILDKAFKNKKNSPFTFNTFEEALVEIKETWKVRPKVGDFLLNKLIHRANSKGLRVKKLLDFSFGKIPSYFSFSNKDEAVKEAKSTWKSFPNYRDLKYVAFKTKCLKLKIQHKEIFEGLFGKRRENKFKSKNINGLLKEIKDIWSERPSGKKDRALESLYSYIRNGNIKENVTVKEILDIAFGEKQEFKFNSYEEALKEARNFWKEKPKSTDLFYKRFSSRCRKKKIGQKASFIIKKLFEEEKKIFKQDKKELASKLF